MESAPAQGAEGGDRMQRDGGTGSMVAVSRCRRAARCDTIIVRRLSVSSRLKTLQQKAGFNRQLLERHKLRRDRVCSARLVWRTNCNLMQIHK